MMAAMMLPGAVPAVSRFVRVEGRLLAAPLSYLALWTIVGLAVYALYQPHGTFVAGALTVAAGVYELTRSSAAAAAAVAKASARDSSSGSTASARASG
jgi:hypothetical protein